MDTLTEDDACKVTFVLAIKDAMNAINGKWKLQIVCALLSGPKRFSDIERLLGGITPRMASRELRELEINGIVEKVSSTDAKSRSSRYQLTESGKALEQVVILMADWGVLHRQRSIKKAPAVDAVVLPQ